LASAEAAFRLAAIVESSDDAIVSKDLAGIITSWNKGAERLFGYTAEEVIGKSVTILIPPERHAEEQYLLERIRRGERVEHYETVRRCKDGSRIEISLTVSPIKRADGKIIGASKIARDITERKRGEERFRRLNETFASVLECIPDIIFLTRGDGSISFKNPAGSRFTRAIQMGDCLPEPIHSEFTRVMQTGVHHWPTTLKSAHPFLINNEEHYFLSRIVAMTAADERIFGAVVLLQDVTEARLLDEAKTNLVSTVSHELKTPITSLRSALSVVLEQTIGPLSTKQAELLTIAQADVERLLRTVNSLLDLKRLEENVRGLKLETAQPEELVKAAVQETELAAANAQVNVKVELEPGLPSLKLDRERISHVLTNILTNAINYSPGGSQILVRAHRQDEEVQFSVVDAGPGVPHQYQSRIFERFFRVPDTAKKGTGLGLSIAREFIEAHRGRIGVRSEPGRGSEFYFTLPVNGCHVL
jgi:PAS domain S-box-containing protein